MRRLIVMRHAKAIAPEAFEGADRDRPLNERGRRDAAAMADRLIAFGVSRVDMALVSTAARTRETWALMAERLSCEPAVFDDDLYLTDARGLAIAASRAAPADTVLIIGHNPGLRDYANDLLLAPNPHDPAGAALLRARFPTAHAAVFAIEGALADNDVRLETVLAP